MGLCCHYLVEGVNVLAEKHLQLGKFQAGGYSDKDIITTYVRNVDNLTDKLSRIFKESTIRHFRVSSSLLPLSDKVTVDYKSNEYLCKSLSRLGQLVRSSGVRFTTHPGQFCVLSSDSRTVIDNTISELSVHGWIFDSMGLDRSPFYAINIHGGKRDRHETLVRSIDKLPDSVRSRLTLENDESSYSVSDLFEVFDKTGVPVCFDSHHHTFNEGHLSLDEAFAAACETWRDVKPLQHLSNSKHVEGNFSLRRQHSDYISNIPECQLSGLRSDSIDVEIEAKMKNHAIDKIRKDFNIDRL